MTMFNLAVYSNDYLKEFWQFKIPLFLWVNLSNHKLNSKYSNSILSHIWQYNLFSGLSFGTWISYCFYHTEVLSYFPSYISFLNYKLYVLLTHLLLQEFFLILFPSSSFVILFLTLIHWFNWLLFFNKEWAQFFSLPFPKN